MILCYHLDSEAWWNGWGTSVEKVLKEDRARSESAFAFGSLFRMVLDDAGIKPSAAALGLNRERSLMYKWLSGKVVPPSYYFPDIVALVSAQASEARKRILENRLRSTVEGLSMARDVRAKVLSSRTFDELLFECLHLSTMPGAGAAPTPAAAVGLRWLSLALAGAFFAAMAGGVLWSALNRALGWPYYMGSSDAVLRGFRALVWGAVTTIPIPLPFFLMYRSGERRRLAAPMAAFALAGSLAGFAFHDLGIRKAIEGAALGYRPQEIVIVLAYSAMLSIPPLLAASLFLSRGRLVPRHALVFLAPVAGSLLGLLFTFLINRPVSEILQLRGFIVGFVMKLLMFTSLIWADRLSLERPPS
jgi:hypothetical protein